jgi:hypothetical protein
MCPFARPVSTQDKKIVIIACAGRLAVPILAGKAAMCTALPNDASRSDTRCGKHSALRKMSHKPFASPNGAYMLWPEWRAGIFKYMHIAIGRRERVLEIFSLCFRSQQNSSQDKAQRALRQKLDGPSNVNMYSSFTFCMAIKRYSNIRNIVLLV